MLMGEVAGTSRNEGREEALDKKDGLRKRRRSPLGAFSKLEGEARPRRG